MSRMDLNIFYRELPKIELHAHLNGSLSDATMHQLKRYLADAGISDKTNIFFEDFKVESGDSRSFTDCFQVFKIAQSLTTTPETLSLATSLTLQEFQDDGCCYIELRSTPRQTPYMTRKQYIETMVQTMQKASVHLAIIPRLIVSLDRRSEPSIIKEIAELAIEYHKLHPQTVVGLEISGDPTVGLFEDVEPVLEQARQAGLKITLHCGEIPNPKEVCQMLDFKPDRIGHGTCIHPRLGGSADAWAKLCAYKTPVEICLTSNVNSKTIPDYESHHFKELCAANIPMIICTDDKGVFATSLSQEYRMCAETFGLNQSYLARIALNSCQYIFDESVRKQLTDKLLNFINKYSL